MTSPADTGGGLYLTPALYDVVNRPGTAAEVDALERVAQRFAPSGASRWLEPACGTGRYLAVLQNRGFTVAGYDPLPGMLEYAGRRLGRRTRGWQLNVASFTSDARDISSLGPADVAFCPVNSLRHLPDDAAVLAHLGQIRQLLAPDGVYIVGLDLLRAETWPDEDLWEGARGSLHVRQLVQYLPPEPGERFEQVVIAMMVTRPRGVEHHNWS